LWFCAWLDGGVVGVREEGLFVVWVKSRGK
jgi:hypothetical protein